MAYTTLTTFAYQGPTGVGGGTKEVKICHKILAKSIKIFYPQKILYGRVCLTKNVVISTFFPDCPQQEFEVCTSMIHSTPLQQNTCTYLS